MTSGFGVEDDVAVGNNEEAEGVSVPDLSVSYTSEQIEELQQSVNPLERCDNYGVSLYLRTLDCVRAWTNVTVTQ